MLDSYIKFFQAHERILALALVLVFAYFGWNSWLDKSAMDAQTKAAVAQQIAQVQRDADAKIASAVAQQTALFNQAQARYEQEIASLVEAVASRDAASQKQVKQVQASNTTEQAVADLNQAYGVELPSPLTVAQAASVPLPDLQAFSTASIERDTAVADLHDTQTELDKTKGQLDQAVTLDDALHTQVAGLQTEITKNDTAAKQELASCQATARKGKLKWFKIGFVTGFVTGLFTGHAAGL
jgi:hypothetical protein